jgi:adenosylmethionine---8-amino-7-oxononanoate aminotransferase
MHPLAQLDHQYVWHPFTQMRDWRKREPIIIARGRGAELQDVYGRRYLDANSSIWTNLHGHNHPAINHAIQKQLGRISHSSALGLANEPASLLAQKLISAANPGMARQTRTGKKQPTLTKAFFSDNGSTALEVALKMAFEFSRRTRGIRRPEFLSLQGAYHGDTVGAVSLGHIDLFHKAYGPLLFRTRQVMAPYCYRCPYNKAKPERADARVYRQCQWECLNQVEKAFAGNKRKQRSIGAFVFEPLMQGAAGMIPQPATWLKQASEIARANGALLVADEVMTGFGRTGLGEPGTETTAGTATWFGSHKEGVQPDFLCLAKGLTGGYVPMAATLTTDKVFAAFLGNYEEFKTFFHGHSFTGNQLGAAAALASMELLDLPEGIAARRKLERAFADQLEELWRCEAVGDIRRVGLVAGIELVKNWRTRRPFPLAEQAGIRVCEAMAKRGVLTRPVGNVIVLMPPYCTTTSQLRKIITTLGLAIDEVLGAASKQ